jgi:hypothetical protein
MSVLKNESRFQNTAFLSINIQILIRFYFLRNDMTRKRNFFDLSLLYLGNLHMIWKTHLIICFAGQPAACGSIFMSAFQSEGKCSPVSNYSGHYQRPTNFAQPTQQWIHQKCGRQGFLYLSGCRDSKTRHPMEKGKNIYLNYYFSSAVCACVFPSFCLSVFLQKNNFLMDADIKKC